MFGSMGGGLDSEEVSRLLWAKVPIRKNQTYHQATQLRLTRDVIIILTTVSEMKGIYSFMMTRIWDTRKKYVFGS